jgi:hypothetical protein
MAKLTEPQKLFIVRALACFDTPSEVAKAFRQEFGVDITRQQVAEYDPTKASGRDVSRRLRAEFEKTRAAFMAEVDEIPISHLAVRLRSLQRMLERADSQGNIALVCKLLEQAAKEVGGMFTNRRELTGARGGPIVQTTAGRHLSDEELYKIMGKLNAEV